MQAAEVVAPVGIVGGHGDVRERDRVARALGPVPVVALLGVEGVVRLVERDHLADVARAQEVEEGGAHVGGRGGPPALGRVEGRVDRERAGAVEPPRLDQAEVRHHDAAVGVPQRGLPLDARPFEGDGGSGGGGGMASRPAHGGGGGHEHGDQGAQHVAGAHHSRARSQSRAASTWLKWNANSRAPAANRP